MILLFALWLGHAARGAEVDGYRRVAVRLLADRGERPPRYRDSAAHFERLIFYVAPTGDSGFVSARYFVVRDGRRVVVDAGLAPVEIESIEDHEARQFARRAQILRTAAFANAPVEDTREPMFVGEGRVLRRTSHTEGAFVQIAVAILDDIQTARANDLPVHVHLIHDERSPGRDPRTFARRFSVGVARVEPLRSDERELVDRLTELDRAGCEGGLRN